MDTPHNTTSAKESLVTGVSRSGRVRKKSSKLLDFQSPDEVEKKPKRMGRQGRPPGTRGRLPGTVGAVRGRRPLSEHTELDVNGDLEGDAEDLFGNLDTDDLAAEVNTLGDTLITPDSDDELDELVAGLVEGVEAESLDQHGESKVRQSLYMTEKANKRKMLKDGRVITGKVERKDKGKSRYTAYSMWAREFRKTSKFSKNQDLDFSNAARRLSELWANVSTKEKNAWRRKAKLQATKAKARDRNTTEISGGAGRATAYNSAFHNRATTNRTRKLAADQQQQQQQQFRTSQPQQQQQQQQQTMQHHIQRQPPLAQTTGHVQQSTVKVPAIQQRRRRNNSLKPIPGSTIGTLNTSLATRQHANANANNQQQQQSQHHHHHHHQHHQQQPSQDQHQHQQQNQQPQQIITHKACPPGIETIDAAAHLKLLGESLTIIGERLKQHEGQIAVSGSLSVLLDSLLCSMGPLLCLTKHIPGLEKRQQLRDNLAATLDNIAYVMPGL